jgi:hypothetical protein
MTKSSTEAIVDLDESSSVSVGNLPGAIACPGSLCWAGRARGASQDHMVSTSVLYASYGTRSAPPASDGPPSPEALERFDRLAMVATLCRSVHADPCMPHMLL